jgi:uncharacterized cupin superfamily protein
MHIERHSFETREDVYRDMIDTGFWPTTYISGPSPELPLHWHAGDVIGYVLSGSTYLLDEHGERQPLSAGDKLVIPAGALHAEGTVTETVTYIVTTRDPKPFLETFTMLDPRAWPRPEALALDPELLAELARMVTPP